MANTYLNQDNVDDLGRMVTSLLSELWIMRDRMAVLEHLLIAQGTLTEAQIEDFDWPADKAQAIETLRDRMVASVIGAPLAARERTVEQILARAGYDRS